WDTTRNGADNILTLQLQNIASNSIIFWGDGTSTVGTSTAPSKTYATAGTYTVSMVGPVGGLNFNGSAAISELMSVERWGNVAFTTMNRAFHNATNLTVNATDTPDLKNVTSMTYMFSSSTNLKGNFANWDTSNVTDMSAVFYLATNFNSDISSWNTSNVTTMESMFQITNGFNQNIGSWNTANVTNMASMFNEANGFNQSLNSWNTAKVTAMNSMFSGADSFDGNISNWNTTAVTNMSNMFQNATAFNQNIGFNQTIGSWNTINVTNMSSMFYGAKAFNQNIGGWNTGKVTNMSNMFHDADAFNQSLDSWDVSKVTSFAGMFAHNNGFNGNITSWTTSAATNMSEMFRNTTAFNQNIGGWNTSLVTNMWAMFYQTSVFNQSLQAWNVSNVTNMQYMFTGAVSFNQNIGSWNVANVTTMSNMLDSSGIKGNNYDAILNGWAAQTVKTNVTLGASGLKYSSAGQAGRTTLTSSPYTWTINGDSLVTQGSATADTATATEAGGTSNGTTGTTPNGNVLTNDTGTGLAVVGVAAGTVGSASGSVGSSVTGMYGSINVSSTGAYTYTVDNSNAAVQALRTTANTLTDVYTYSMTDTNGYTKTTQITVTIQGANDAPTVSQVTGAVAAYDFENGSGNASSVVADGPAMSIGTGVTYNTSAGRFTGSTGLLFGNDADSTTPPVTLASIPNVQASNAFSFSGWVRFDALSGTQGWERIFDFGNGTLNSNLLLGRQGVSNNLYVESWTAGAVTTGSMSITNAITTGNWMHVALTVNSSNLVTLYVNGTSVGSYTASSAMNYAGWTKNYIGASNWAVDRQFRGAMDDIAIFDKALTAGEVATLASAVTAPTIVNKSIAENSANGTNVFDARSSDLDSGDGVIYSIQSGNTNSTFAINSTTGQVTVANSSNLNFEANSSYALVVRATDTAGLATDQTVTVTVADVNEAPNDITLGSAPTGLTTSGNASLVSGTTYQLTPNSQNQSGAVWGAVNLSQDVTITSKMYFGASNSGADGMSFAFQKQASTAIGGGANGFGVNGITSAFGIGFDTYYNGTNNEINSDFTQFFKQGATANQGTTFDTANAHDNIEDGLWHDVVIVWNASTKTLSYSLDGVAIDSKTYDVVATDWGGNANGYFGFGAGTGGATNQQQVEIISVQTGSSTSIAENSTSGTVVCLATAVDPDRTGTVTYSLTDNAGGRFAINSSTGQITVADGSLLNFEAATSHAITVRVTDQGGLTYDETMNISLTNVNETPSDMGFGTQFVGDASKVVSGNATMPSLDDFTLEIKATPQQAIMLVAESNGGVTAGVNGGMAIMADHGDGVYGTTGTATRSIGLAIGTNGVVVYQHSSNLFASLLTYSGAIAPDSDIAVVFVNKTPSLYINGVLVDTGIQSTATSLRPTVGSVAGTGVGGGSAVGGRYFDGTLSDYRIWNSALDATTINNNRTSVFATGTPGLLANMIVSSINENATNGTVVGQARGYDPDAGATLTYVLQDNDGGRFAIDSSTGEITVANGSLLDFETSVNHTITVRTIDQAGLTYDENVTIRLRNVNETPTALTLTGSTTGAGSSAVYNATTDSYYAFVSTAMTWEAAMDNAQSSLLGGVAGTLVNVNSSTEQTYVAGLSTNSLWTGASDKMQQGVWRWFAGDTAGAQFWSGISTGAAVGGAYASWSAGEPNDYGGLQDYGLIYGTASSASRSWDDSNAEAAVSSVIEWSGAAFRAAAGVASSVMENASAGTVVGTLAATDPDSGDTFTYTLVGGATSKFEIAGTQLRVKAGATFDFETTPVETVTVRVTDGGGSTRDLTTTISVVNVNEAPNSASLIRDVTIANSSFESQTLSPGAFNYTITGWTGSGNLGGTGQSGVQGASSTNYVGNTVSGANIAFASGVATLSQTLSENFDSAKAYQLTVAVGDRDESTPGLNQYRVQLFAGATLIGETIGTPVSTGLNDVQLYVDGAAYNAAQNGALRIEFGTTAANGLSSQLGFDNVRLRVFEAPTLSISENTSNGTVVGKVGANDFDPGSVLTYSLTNNAGGAYAINKTTGMVTVANSSLLNFESTPTNTIVVRTTDQGGLTFDKTVTISLTNVNEGPIAIADTATAVEAGGVSNSTPGTNPMGNVLTNDSDVDAGDTKTVSGVAAGTVSIVTTNVGNAVTGDYGSITIAADGAYIYTVDNTNTTVQALRLSSQTLTDVFTYTMQDASGLTSTTQITVTIQGVNDTPTDITGVLTIAENSVNGTSAGTVSSVDLD
ncbi:MAG: BspA family leucine-rich repeat surface protein, partial [Pirellula sp.]